MISLYNNVPKTSRKKAKSSPQLKASAPVARLITQMNSVRQVSIVDRWAAEAYFVIETPVALKHEIDKIMPMDINVSCQYSPSCLKASTEFST